MKNTVSNTQQTADQVIEILESLHKVAVWRGIVYHSYPLAPKSLEIIRKGDINSAFGRLNALLKFNVKTGK